MSELDRRRALTAIVGSLAASQLAGRKLAAQPAEPAERTFPAVDRAMEAALDELQLAGGSVAIAHRGELVLARAYGLADVERDVPMEPSSVFTIASVSKPLTAVGILQLVKDGRLELEARLVDVLARFRPQGTQLADPRFAEITVHQLLYHAGGLVRDVQVGPQDAQSPAEDDDGGGQMNLEALYRKLLTLPLEFAPGSKHVYSNAGFLVLRLVVEVAAGEPYEAYLRRAILQPMGITRVRMERGGDYERDEAHRYQAGGRKPAARFVSNWLASTPALVRFAIAVAGSAGEPFLGRKMTDLMLAKPPGMQPAANGSHVGLGWDVVRHFPEGRFLCSKNGSKPGVRVWLEHLPGGIDWSFFVNTNPPKDRNVFNFVRRRMLGVFEYNFGLKLESDSKRNEEEGKNHRGTEGENEE